MPKERYINPDPNTKPCRLCGMDKPLGEYYTNKSSRDGHRHECVDCSLAAHRQWREAHPPDDEYWERKLRNSQRYREAHPTQWRFYNLQAKYGLDREQYEALVESQGNSCAICGVALGEQGSVDHDHETLAVRGLLCRQCNLGIGNFLDHPGLLEVAAEYLRANS